MESLESGSNVHVITVNVYLPLQRREMTKVWMINRRRASHPLPWTPPTLPQTPPRGYPNFSVPDAYPPTLVRTEKIPVVGEIAQGHITYTNIQLVLLTILDPVIRVCNISLMHIFVIKIKAR